MDGTRSLASYGIICLQDVFDIGHVRLRMAKEANEHVDVLNTLTHTSAEVRKHRMRGVSEKCYSSPNESLEGRRQSMNVPQARIRDAFENGFGIRPEVGELGYKLLCGMLGHPWFARRERPFSPCARAIGDDCSNVKL